jgi:hypothetical protein
MGIVGRWRADRDFGIRQVPVTNDLVVRQIFRLAHVLARVRGVVDFITVRISVRGVDIVRADSLFLV